MHTKNLDDSVRQWSGGRCRQDCCSGPGWSALIAALSLWPEIRLGSRGDAYSGQFSHSPPPPPPPNPLPLSSLPRDVYLIKQYLQTWSMEPIYLEMWEGDASCLRWTT